MNKLLESMELHRHSINRRESILDAIHELSAMLLNEINLSSYMSRSVSTEGNVIEVNIIYNGVIKDSKASFIGD